MNEVAEIALRSVMVSGTATLLASTWSIPLAYLAVRRAYLSRYLIPVFESLVGVPTVVVGLVMYGLLSREGPLGFASLLYTPLAIMIGEAVLITPLVTSVAYRVLRKSSETVGELALALGAGEGQAMMLAITESLPGLVGAVVMGFSRAIGELGVALLVGGNIRGETRVLTTAIALEVSKGSYSTALILGGILVGITLSFSIASRLLSRWEV